MEVLNEEDLDWLTRVQNRLVGMRKRETQHRPTGLSVTQELSDAIKAVNNTRVFLQIRFNKKERDELM